MAVDYSIEVCKKLEKKIERYNLYRPKRISRYEEGTELCYEVEGIESGKDGRVYMTVERFVGGGFAGQVYKVRVTKIQAEGGPVTGQSGCSQGGGTLAKIYKAGGKNPPRQ
ncbi:MAG: hypothetical protein ACYSSI_04815 [Planctomycetota bacterium]|jgi:hypothetical protein